MTKTKVTSALSRRQLGGLGLGAAATLSMPYIRRARAADELRIFTWEGYADDQWVEEFASLTGVTPSVTYTGSVDEMFARMKGSEGADFDLLALDTGSFKRYVEQDLIQPVDMSKIPNRSELLPAFQDIDSVKFDGTAYGVPFAWGSLPLIYDADAFPDGAPESWEAMWDPANAQQMIVLDDANNNIVNTAILLGFSDPYNLTDEQFEAIKEKLIEQKRLILTYYAGFEDGVNIFAQGGVKLMFSMGEPQRGMLQERGVNAELTIPKEGAVGWLDCWIISKGAQDPALAMEWINLMTTKAAGAYISETYGYGNCTNAEVNEAAGLTYSDRLSYLQAPEDFAKRVAVWNEVKAAPI